jgi:hypothetical protein
VVGEQLRWVDPVGQFGRLVILAPREGEVRPLGRGAPGAVGICGHRDLLPRSGVELGEPVGLCAGQGRTQTGHTNSPAAGASGDGHCIERTGGEADIPKWWPMSWTTCCPPSSMTSTTLSRDEHRLRGSLRIVGVTWPRGG